MNCDPDELYKWIDSHTISRQKKNLSRDFSDAVPLAEILKHHYPKLVDLHNYSSKNSFSHKILNWEMLNRRVLNKIKINLSSKDIEELAQATPGAVEKLLTKIKNKADAKNACGDANNDGEKIFYLDNVSSFSCKEDIVPVKIKNGTKIIDRKMVPNEVLDRMQKDLVEKKEILNTQKTRIEHLENLLKVKDERIKDLTQQLQTIVNGKNLTSEPKIVSARSRFFDRIF